ncbi:MAG: twin-arginine translocase subunit TatC [Chloroflexi bacterium]|nr:twin-arginine translocase subunit TatC [Chloroflexota bacterium]
MIVPQKLKSLVETLTTDPGEEGEEELGGEMTLLEHLEELRSRIVKMAIAVVVGTVIALIITPLVFEVIQQPLPAGKRLVAIEMTESFVSFFKVAIFTGVALALPVLVYQVFRFVAPGLTRREKHYLFMMLPFVTMFFLFGLLFGYFVLLPSAVGFLLNFGGEFAEPFIRISNYITFVTTILFWMGIVFETPLLMFMLAKLHIVSARRLASFRKYALLVIFVVAAVITPTPDPLNQTLVAVPMYILYEVGILLARFAWPSNA